MKLALFGLCFAALVVVLVLGLWIPVWRGNRRAEGGVVNHDELMTRFVFRVPMAPEAILPALTARNAADALRCTAEPGGMTLCISEEHGADVRYACSVQPCDGFCILRLTQTTTTLSRGLQAYRLNPFVMEKLQAEPLPYHLYWI